MAKLLIQLIPSQSVILISSGPILQLMWNHLRKLRSCLNKISVSIQQYAPSIMESYTHTTAKYSAFCALSQNNMMLQLEDASARQDSLSSEKHVKDKLILFFFV